MSERVLIDGFSRRVDYLRMSVTDRCDFRCVYCMAEDMQFLPRQRVLTLEEIYQVAQSFVALGDRRRAADPPGRGAAVPEDRRPARPARTVHDHQRFAVGQTG